MSSSARAALAPLPIDSLIPDIVASLQRTSSLVLEAPPGAGKTTRVPRALLDAGVEGEILVLEPRRLAARMAARRVAQELGERVGETIGYRVRFEDAVSARTRVVFVTEGVLTRRLLSDPELRGVGAVLLDEFHERHLQGDVALALLRRLQQRRRELALVVMSATLDAEPIAAFLDCPSLRAEGRRFDVAIEYAARAAASDRPLESEVAAALRQLVAEGLDGDVLVIPARRGGDSQGAGRVRRAGAAAGIDVVMLHGDLTPEEQDRAVAPGPRRKLILSTNVAETSITIEGVVAVIDTGLARVASFSPWSGVPTLKVQRISRASATQRAGRAGRLDPDAACASTRSTITTPGPLQDTPEVRRLDLADPLLLLASTGVRADELAWLEAPPPAALEAARALLARLGAIDERERITPLGRRMMRFPLHPRQARLVVEAEARGVGRQGCVLAALIGERDLVWQRPRRAELSGDSDLLADLDRFAEASRGGLQPDRARSLGLDAGAALTIDRVRRQLEPLVERGRAPAGDADTALRQAILAGYPDRVARRRRQGAPELLLSGGGTAQLSDASVVRDAELMVVVDAEQRSDRAGGAIVARSATAIETDWLIDVAADRLREVAAYEWNAAAERVEVVERMTYDALVLDERRAWPSQVARADAGGGGADARTRRRARAGCRRSSTPRTSSGCAGASRSCASTCRRRRCPSSTTRSSTPRSPSCASAATAWRSCARPTCSGRWWRGSGRKAQALLGARGARQGGAAGRAPGARAVSGGAAAVHRLAPAGLLRDGRGSDAGARARAADAAPVGAEPAGGAGDLRSRGLLGAALSGAAPRARPPLSAPRVARGSAARRAAGAASRRAPRRSMI